MFYCSICGCGDCCERTDIPEEPVLCDSCYYKYRLGVILLNSVAKRLRNK